MSRKDETCQTRMLEMEILEIAKANCAMVMAVAELEPSQRLLEEKGSGGSEAGTLVGSSKGTVRFPSLE